MKKLLIVLTFCLLFTSIWAGPIDRQIDTILKEYFRIHKTLSQDSTNQIDEASHAIIKAALDTKSSDAQVQKLISEIKKAAQKIQGQSLESSRDIFFELSKPMLVYVNKYHSEKKKYSRFYCSMVNKAWVQSHETVENPYHGSSMLRCGELIE